MKTCLHDLKRKGNMIVVYTTWENIYSPNLVPRASYLHIGRAFPISKSRAGNEVAALCETT